MVKEKYVPSDAFVKKVADIAKTKFASFEGKDISLSDADCKKNVRNSTEILFVEPLHGAVHLLSFYNFTTRDTHKKPQISENIKISLISDSREKCIPCKDIIDGLNQDFYDYISKTGGYSTGKGKFYMEHGKIYFEAKEFLPPLTKRGDSIVVGGIGFE